MRPWRQRPCTFNDRRPDHSVSLVRIVPFASDVTAVSVSVWTGLQIRIVMQEKAAVDHQRLLRRIQQTEIQLRDIFKD
jgi:hypothetical protein